MEAARRAGWRYALLLLALVAAGGADSRPRIDSQTDIAPHRAGRATPDNAPGAV